MEGSVRITVLATGFNPYAPEGRAVAEAVYRSPKSDTFTVAGETKAPTQTEIKPVVEDTIQGLVNDTPPAKRSAEQQKVANVSDVFDDIDLDIPAFIRDSKRKQSKD
jgi:cell division protein FtsZ